MLVSIVHDSMKKIHPGFGDTDTPLNIVLIGVSGLMGSTRGQSHLHILKGFRDQRLFRTTTSEFVEGLTMHGISLGEGRRSGWAFGVFAITYSRRTV